MSSWLNRPVPMPPRPLPSPHKGPFGQQSCLFWAEISLLGGSWDCHEREELGGLSRLQLLGVPCRCWGGGGWSSPTPRCNSLSPGEHRGPHSGQPAWSVEMQSIPTRLLHPGVATAFLTTQICPRGFPTATTAVAQPVPTLLQLLGHQGTAGRLWQLR